MTKKTTNQFIYIGAIICLTIIILSTNDKISNTICSIGIGMNLMLLVDTFSKKSTEAK